MKVTRILLMVFLLILSFALSDIVNAQTLTPIYDGRTETGSSKPSNTDVQLIKGKLYRKIGWCSETMKRATRILNLLM